MAGVILLFLLRWLEMDTLTVSRACMYCVSYFALSVEKSFEIELDTLSNMPLWSSWKDFEQTRFNFVSWLLTSKALLTSYKRSQSTIKETKKQINGERGPGAGTDVYQA